MASTCHLVFPSWIQLQTPAASPKAPRNPNAAGCCAVPVTKSRRNALGRPYKHTGGVSAGSGPLLAPSRAVLCLPRCSGSCWGRFLPSSPPGHSLAGAGCSLRVSHSCSLLELSPGTSHPCVWTGRTACQLHQLPVALSTPWCFRLGVAHEAGGKAPRARMRALPCPGVFGAHARRCPTAAPAAGSPGGRPSPRLTPAQHLEVLKAAPASLSAAGPTRTRSSLDSQRAEQADSGVSAEVEARKGLFEGCEEFLPFLFVLFFFPNLLFFSFFFSPNQFSSLSTARA